MFKIGDRIQHKKTGEVGTVIGYSHQLIDNSYLLTIKVRLFRETGMHPILEDVFTEWFSWKEKVFVHSSERNLPSKSIA